MVLTKSNSTVGTVQGASQRVASWVNDGIVVGIYDMWPVYLLFMRPHSGVGIPYSTVIGLMVLKIFLKGCDSSWAPCDLNIATQEERLLLPILILSMLVWREKLSWSQKHMNQTLFECCCWCQSYSLYEFYQLRVFWLSLSHSNPSKSSLVHIWNSAYLHHILWNALQMWFLWILLIILLKKWQWWPNGRLQQDGSWRHLWNNQAVCPHLLPYAHCSEY